MSSLIKNTMNALGLGEVCDGITSSVIGLYVTAKYMIKPTVTMHYPDQRWIMYKDTRNWLRLIKNEETGEELCTGCGSCVRICPCSCIRVVGKKATHRKGLVPDMFEIDFSLCCFCGLCVEACPFDAIKFCAAYEMACYDRQDLIWDKEKLLSITDDFVAIKESKRVSSPYIPQWKAKVDEYIIP